MSLWHRTYVAAIIVEGHIDDVIDHAGIPDLVSNLTLVPEDTLIQLFHASHVVFKHIHHCWLTDLRLLFNCSWVVFGPFFKGSMPTGLE